MKKISIMCVLVFLAVFFSPGSTLYAWLDQQDIQSIERYEKALAENDALFLLNIIDDKEEEPNKKTAAVKVLRKKTIEDNNAGLRGRYKEALDYGFLKSQDSLFKIEASYSLIAFDKDKNFSRVFEFLLKRIDYENSIVNSLAFERLNDILKLVSKEDKTKAKFILNKVTRAIERPNEMHHEGMDLRLKQKLALVRWAVGILGEDAAGKLPTDVKKALGYI